MDWGIEFTQDSVFFSFENMVLSTPVSCGVWTMSGTWSLKDDNLIMKFPDGGDIYIIQKYFCRVSDKKLTLISKEIVIYESDIKGDLRIKLVFKKKDQ
ncbi:MAG: hypothetical protein QNK23_11450 [Crocinitomicaceae bacterium]|nr:hypothetical protein [Crocinitomicaceae bacterium]